MVPIKLHNNKRDGKIEGIGCSCYNLKLNDIFQIHIFYFLMTVVFQACCNNNPTNTRTLEDDYVYDSVSQFNSVHVDSINTNTSLVEDSFTIVYRQKVHGYSVKAIIRLNLSWEMPTLQADLHFTKGRRSFVLHSECFGDTVYNKGREDFRDENIAILKKNRNKTIIADYNERKDPDRLFPPFTPFFFLDLDFDGIDELVIVNYSWGVRYCSTYDVYRIVEGIPFRIGYPPYCSEYDDNEGMTDYPQFDFVNKTISCNYPEGELSYIGCRTYGIDKNKDLIKVNGHSYYFNHLSLIKDKLYDDEFEYIIQKQ